MRQHGPLQAVDYYQTLIEASADIITVIDGDGDIRYESPSIESALGYGQDELVGENAFEYVHPDDRQRAFDEFASSLEDPSYEPRFEARFRHANGTWRVLEGRGRNLLDDPDVEGFVVVSRDVTKRRQREETLDSLSTVTVELLRADDERSVCETAVAVAEEVLHEPTAGVWLFDETTETLTLAASGSSLPDDFDDRPFAEGEGLLWDVFAAQESWNVGDVREIPERLAVPETNLRSVVLVPLGGYGVLGIGAEHVDAFDRSDVRFAEILGGNVAATLSRLAHERDLERQNERLDRFASMVAHDLRNPLTVAQGFLDLASESGDSAHFEKVERAHRKMEQIISNLLDVAQHRVPVLDVEAVSLEDVATDVWKDLAAADATLTVESSSTIRADAAQLTQVLQNLLGNALAHGGSDVTVRVGLLEDGFYVEDDGSGIDPEERDHVFDVGYTTADEGTGYGLLIVQEVVSAHGWAIDLVDGSMGGARFEVTGVQFCRPAGE